MLIATDTSEHNAPLDGTYPREAVILRAAWGTWKMDDRFLTNTSAARALWDAGKLRGGAVLYQPPLTDATAQEAYAYLWRLIGPTVPDWLTGIMLDVESWRGESYEIRGDHSPMLNALYGLNAHRMGSWLGCKAYGNFGDLSTIWPHRDVRCEYIEANYGTSMPTRPGKIGQQYTDGSARWPAPKGMPTSTAPFGHCDHNVFPGINDPASFRRAWGRSTWADVHATPNTAPTPAPKPPAVTPQPRPYYNAARGNALVSPDGSRALFLHNDGSVEIRHNGTHQATLTEK